MKLPFSALAFACPAIAALILAYREEGPAGTARLLRRVFDLNRIPHRIWLVPILFLLPFLYSLSYSVMHLLGLPLPDPQIAVLPILILLVVFLISAAGEEIGWTGYALDTLQGRWGALGAALVIGLVWAGVHVVPDLQGHQSLEWIVGQRSFSVALRVLMVWLYNNTGKSLFATIVFHATDNVSVFTLFPNGGGFHYNPAVTAALTGLTAAVVTFLWGPKTLAHCRKPGPSSGPLVS